MDKQTTLSPETRIGHIHLKVSNLERAVEFYTKVIGFDVVSRMGKQAAFLSAGGYHHHLGLNTWESAGGSPPPSNTTGLYHFAILVPSRVDLAKALKRLIENKYPIDGAADHAVSEAIYLHDPDQSGIEIYCDRAREEWPRNPDGSYAMVTKALDLDALLAEAE